MTTLVERIEALRTYMPPSDAKLAWEEMKTILADVRELQEAAMLGRDALAGLYHGAGCGLSDEAMSKCTNCKAHAQLSAILTKTGAIK